MTGAMTCSDCARLAIQAESLHRALETARADLAELEREREGLLAEVARLKDRNYALALQVTGGIP